MTGRLISVHLRFAVTQRHRLSFEQRRANLFEKERIASGTLVQPLRQRVGDAAGAEDRGHDRGTRCEIQLLEIDPRAVRWPHPIGFQLQTAGDDQHQGARADEVRDAHERGPRAGVRPLPVLDQHDQRRLARQHADEGCHGVEQCRLEVFTLQMSRKRVPVAAHREQMQEQGQEGLERRVDGADACRDRVRVSERRPEIEGATQNLHEDTVRNAVAVGQASRLQHTHAGRAARRSCSS